MGAFGRGCLVLNSYIFLGFIICCRLLCGWVCFVGCETGVFSGVRL